MNTKDKQYKIFKRKMLKVRNSEQFEKLLKEKEQTDYFTPKELIEIQTEFNNTMEIALKGKTKWIKAKLKSVFIRKS